MVPLQKKLTNIQQHFVMVKNDTVMTLVEELEQKLWFDPLLESLLEVNEIRALDIKVSQGSLVLVPVFCEGVTTGDALHRDMVGAEYVDLIYTSDETIATLDFKLRDAWTVHDHARLIELCTRMDPVQMLQEALIVAEGILSRSPYELAIVCGPISSGSKPVAENFRIFNRTVFKVAQHRPVFNQLPFETLFAQVHILLRSTHTHLCDGESSSRFFIDYFYRALFAADKAWLPYFIYGWEESTGARIEHEIFTTADRPIVLLEEGYERMLY